MKESGQLHVPTASPQGQSAWNQLTGDCADVTGDEDVSDKWHLVTPPSNRTHIVPSQHQVITKSFCYWLYCSTLSVIFIAFTLWQQVFVRCINRPLYIQILQGTFYKFWHCYCVMMRNCRSHCVLSISVSSIPSPFQHAPVTGLLSNT